MTRKGAIHLFITRSLGQAKEVWELNNHVSETIQYGTWQAVRWGDT